MAKKRNGILSVLYRLIHSRPLFSYTGQYRLYRLQQIQSFSCTAHDYGFNCFDQQNDQQKNQKEINLEVLSARLWNVFNCRSIDLSLVYSFIKPLPLVVVP